MYYDVKKVPDAPVVVGTWYEGFKYVEQGANYVREANALLNAQKTPVFYILDFSQLRTMSIEGLMMSADSGARGSNPNLHHPMVRGTIFVSRDALVKMAANGMKSATYGSLNIKFFGTIEDALAYVKSEV